MPKSLGARTALSALVLTGLSAALLPTVASASPEPPGQALVKRAPAAKGGAHHPGTSDRLIDLKLVEHAGLDAAGGEVSGPGKDVPTLKALLKGARVASTTPLFRAGKAELTTTRDAAQSRSQREQADLSLWQRVTLRPGQDMAEALAALNAHPLVETAYAAPLATEPAAGPDLRSRQGYHSPASASGIDANYAWTVAGGRGANVRVHDIEYGWNSSHEDLSKIRAAYIANGTYANTFGTDHGTAVVGEIVGDDNAYGVTGLVPDATMRLTNIKNTERGYDPANAVYVAAANLRAGDVMLLEAQTSGPGGACGQDQVGCIPVEYYAATYDAIVSATSRGIHVVEAAGNGYQNLDSGIYGGAFTTRADSGAVIVGAGGAPGCTGARTRLSYSNYGSRVSLQGWGECVTTTGYGAAYSAGGVNSYYTNGFAGTSSASPIVASAVAALSSIAKQRGYVLTPSDLRNRLRATGTAQSSTVAGSIGPLPNLRAAIANLPGGSGTDTTAPTVTAPKQYVANGSTLGTTVPVRATWSASDAGGVAGYAVYLATNGGAYQQLTLSSATATSVNLTLARNSTYRLAYAAKDNAGNWSAYSYGAAFGVGAYEENSGYVTYGGSWAYTAYSSASGGQIALTSATSASASFTFTGRNVAWVASKGTNRGKASIYLDGAYQGTVDLYSATTAARSVAASYTWPTSGTHTIKVVAQGTSGRPKVDVDAFVRLT